MSQDDVFIEMNGDLNALLYRYGGTVEMHESFPFECPMNMLEKFTISFRRDDAEKRREKRRLRMNEPFGDTHPDLPMPPKEWQWLDDLRPDESTLRRKRVLTLAREMMLHDACHGEGVKAAPYHFENYTIAAAAWIRYEDAYTLPEDMQ